jgi:hypothetical protein
MLKCFNLKYLCLLSMFCVTACSRGFDSTKGSLETRYLKLDWEGQRITVALSEGGRTWHFDLAQKLRAATDSPGYFVQQWSIDFGMDERPVWNSPGPVLQSIESPSPDSLLYCYKVNGTAFTVGFRLLEDAPEIEVTVSADTAGDRVVTELEAPGACCPESGEITTFFIPYLQGIVWQRDLQASFIQHFRVYKRVVGLSMPFYLVNSGEDWMMCVYRTPDDAALTIYKERGKEPDITPRFYRSLKSLRYERKLIYRFAHGSGYPELCKIYRDRFVKPEGNYKTFAEKTAERPILEKALGAPYVFLGYYNQTADTVMMALDTLKAMGYDQALVIPFRFYNPGGKGTEHLSPGIPIDFPDLADKVRALGYLPCGWLLVNHYTKQSPVYDPDLIARSAQGEPIKCWRIGKDLEWQAMLPDKIIPALKKEEQDWIFLDGFHFDTGASTGLFESFSTDRRAFTRTDDRQFRTAYFKYFTDRGKINISEGAQTWTVPYLDVGSVHGTGDWIEEGLQYKLVPLWHLVFHECLQGAWHEGQTYQAGNFREKFLCDMAWGCPPTIAPIMCLYRYNSREAGGSPAPYGHNFLRPDGKQYKKQIRESVNVYRLAREVAGAEMTDHAFLDNDRHVTRSRFSTGHVVYVNLGEKAYLLPDDRRIEGKNYLVDKP